MTLMDLNNLEYQTITHILQHNIQQYPFLMDHMSKIYVSSRTYTGVGLYVFFAYQDTKNITIKKSLDTALSGSSYLKMNNLTHPLNYELNITDGKIDFLEYVTNDEEWNGIGSNFEFLKI